MENTQIEKLIHFWWGDLKTLSGEVSNLHNYVDPNVSETGRIRYNCKFLVDSEEFSINGQKSPIVSINDGDYISVSYFERDERELVAVINHSRKNKELDLGEGSLNNTLVLLFCSILFLFTMEQLGSSVIFLSGICVLFSVVSYKKATLINKSIESIKKKSLKGIDIRGNEIDLSKEKLSLYENERIKDVRASFLDRQKLNQLNELLEIEYNNLYELRKQMPQLVGQKLVALKNHIKLEVVPRIQEYEVGVAKLLKEGVSADSIPVQDAQEILKELCTAVEKINNNGKLQEKRFEEINNTLRDLREKLNEPGKSAVAKLKRNVQ